MRHHPLYRLYKTYQLTTKYLMVARRMEKACGHLPTDELDRLKQEWAKDLLQNFRINLHVTGSPPLKSQAILVGNHISYIDIPMLMAVTPAVFVAKAELASWPIIGSGCKRVGTIMVKRENGHSRRNAGQTIGRYVQEEKSCVAIFPSGTTTIQEDKPWRTGAFKIAQQFDIPLQPFRLWFRPLRSVAYIDRDVLPVQMYRLLSEPVIDAYLDFHHPITISNPRAQAEEIRAWSQDPHFRDRPALAKSTTFPYHPLPEILNENSMLPS